MQNLTFFSEKFTLFLQGERNVAVVIACYLSAVLRSCSQLRVPLRWRGQATAAVVTESTKPQIQPQERWVCTAEWGTAASP